jgi:uncharacterized protein (TIGR03435 family)
MFLVKTVMAFVAAFVWLAGIASNFTQAGQPQRQPARTHFEEVSVRRCDPDNLPEAPEWARGGGANSFRMTPGRTQALCVTLATLIRTAYGYAPADFVNDGGRDPAMTVNIVYGLGVEDGRRVRGAPDWVLSERYTIEAVTDGATDAAVMRGPMLRALLEDRFRLQAHIESEQVPAFDLTANTGGLKVKPVGSDACEPLPARVPGSPPTVRRTTLAEVQRGRKPNCGLFVEDHGPNLVWVAGGVALGRVARMLASPLGLGSVQVIDKTGSTGTFNFVLEFAVDANIRGQVVGPRQAEPTADVPRAATIRTALEEQLGLRLVPTRAPREFIVIDRVERPTAN